MRASSIVIVVASLTSAACSLAVTFDRSRIGDGGMDAAVDGGACDPATHAGCGPSELCCPGGNGPVCVATGSGQCEACATACTADSSSACVERTCRCGDGPACAGATPLCDDAAGACVECRDASDCTDRQCVSGRCVDCDRSDNSGCSGETPICNASDECEACGMDPDNCPGILVCTPSGACGGCDPGTHEGCETRTTPICDAESTLCRACASHEECMAERGRDHCLSDGRCAVCDPADHAGCGGATPICRAGADGALACAACANDGECAGRAATPVCAESGANAGACVACDAGDASVCAAMGAVCDVGANTCVECTTDGDCGGATPICGSGGTCRGCAETAECTAIATGTVCVTGGAMAGSCGACDPTTAAGCSGTTPVCSAATATCGPCAGDADCAGAAGGTSCVTSGAMTGACAGCDPADGSGCSGTTPICGALLTCVGCTSNAQCSAIGSGTFCATSGARMGGCEACDPADHEGCSGTTPICAAGTATCRGCSGDPECAGNPSGTVCASTGACGMCDPATDAPCGGDLFTCDPATLTCVQCVVTADCTARHDENFVCNASGRCECSSSTPSNRCQCRNTGANCETGQFCVDDMCSST